MDSYSDIKDSRRSDRFIASKQHFKTHTPKTRKDIAATLTSNSQNISIDKLDRKSLIKIAAETIDITDKMIFPKTTYIPEDMNIILPTDLPIFNAKPVFVTANVVDHILTLCKTINNLSVLNFASAKNPCGGFLKGSMAQEEALAYASNLYQSLSDRTAGNMYFKNSQKQFSGIYSSDLIVSENVIFIRDGSHNILKLEDQVNVTVISCPAVNFTAFHGDHTIAIREMQNRVNRILATALNSGSTNIILGAWGCGVFGGNIEELMNTFYNSKYIKYFEHIWFVSIDQTTTKAMNDFYP